MQLSTTLVLSVLLSVAPATVSALCTDVHLFLARGNGEPYPGRVGAIANTVCNGLSSCDAENIIFTSTQSYCGQLQDGVAAGLSQIAAYAARCPNSKLVLAGYSLGAHIVGDILGGGGGSFYTCSERGNAGLSASSGPGRKIVAALMFGDVRHTGNQPYNTGTGSPYDGQYPRGGSQLANLNQFSGVLRSWCLSQDPICALGNDGLSHETYMDVFAGDAGYWVHGVLSGGEPAASSSPPVVIKTTSIVPTPTPTPESSTTPEPTTTFEPPTFSSTSESSTSSSETSTSSSIESSTTSSSTSSSTSTSTSTLSVSSRSRETSFSVPFVFSQTGNATIPDITTSTFVPVTKVSFTTTSSSMVVSTTSSQIVATSTSSAGAYSEGVQFSLTFISLVVVKVLAF